MAVATSLLYVMRGSNPTACLHPQLCQSLPCSRTTSPLSLHLVASIGFPYDSFHTLQKRLGDALAAQAHVLQDYDDEWQSLSHFACVVHLLAAVLGAYRNKTLISRVASKLVTNPNPNPNPTFDFTLTLTPCRWTPSVSRPLQEGKLSPQPYVVMWCMHWSEEPS